MNALLKTASAVLIVAACCVAASGQIVTLGGSVSIKQADGTQTPAAGAVVDIYRTDIAQKYEARADSSGKYTRAGIPFVGTYIVAASAPGAAPDFRTGVRVSQQPEVNFVLAPGDGSRLTLEQIRSGANAAPPVEASAKNAEIDAANKKIVAENEAVSRAFNEGNAALKAAGLTGAAQLAKYDEAIAHYDEGLRLRPDEVALLTNKSVAIRARGVARFNAAITSHDDAAKAAAFADFNSAAELAQKSVEILAARPVPPGDPARGAWEGNRYAALAARAEALRIVAEKAEHARAGEAFRAYEELSAVETDPAKRIAERVSAAKIYVNVGEFQRASVELRKIVADDPSNLDANFYLGMALASMTDKASMKEGATYLQRFLDAAPPNHPMRGDAKLMLDYIKSQ